MIKIQLQMQFVLMYMFLCNKDAFIQAFFFCWFCWGFLNVHYYKDKLN